MENNETYEQKQIRLRKENARLDIKQTVKRIQYYTKMLKDNLTDIASGEDYDIQIMEILSEIQRYNNNVDLNKTIEALTEYKICNILEG